MVACLFLRNGILLRVGLTCSPCLKDALRRKEAHTLVLAWMGAPWSSRISEIRTTTREEPCSPQLEKACTQQQRPSAAINFSFLIY